ncbi:hypothetical protein [Paenibacillus apiarius]|uniref:Uncharacterized protein n=1 Tax=Paenibacillus apiarius TaxID=46240 RepID=A0ABT4DMK8_9BACL|nr:hypothetical protein [Paenibacillus apiarius]MCY9514574.1 hypothetical protein [Paenibacillus apiarius]MCY9518564.1 hypothetical protein [Paenibacillus apiarius]MCY9552652.1 hypothetical protein [Paenibacillus apiarius]MCY9557020.1 hypothetical protein [Paenibacillus apiarius]MCY9686027.1 hypothetical protein [Paenibacillus apiarius]
MGGAAGVRQDMPLRDCSGHLEGIEWMVDILDEGTHAKRRSWQVAEEQQK